MNTLEVTFPALVWDAIRSIAPCASSDDVTPVIQQVQLTVADGMLTAVATNRYIIGRVRYRLDADNAQANFSALIPAKRMSTLKLPTRQNVAQLELIEGNPDVIGRERTSQLSISWGEHVVPLPVTGNYPPVDRLFPADDQIDTLQASPQLWSPKRMTELTKIGTGTGSKRETIMHYHGNVKTDNPAKPGPAYFTIEASGSGDWREGLQIDAILQPNLKR